MKKLIVATLVLLCFGLLAGGVWAYFSLDEKVRRAVVRATKEATGVKVHLKSVRLKASDSSGQLKDFRLANPPGFSTEQPLFQYALAKVNLDVSSLSQPVVRVSKVHLDGVSILFSTGVQGNNLEAMAKRVAERQKQRPPSAQVPYRISIASLVINDARLKLKLPGIEKSVDLPLGPLSFQDLGGQEGASPGEILATISKSISKRATLKATESLPSTAIHLGLSPADLAEKMGLPLPTPIRQAEEFLKDAFKR